MPEAALALHALYLGLAFGLRSWLQWRRTGSTGFHGVGGRLGSAEWLAAGVVILTKGWAYADPLISDRAAKTEELMGAVSRLLRR